MDSKAFTASLCLSLGLAACTTAPKEPVADREPANMGGQNYFVGTYACNDAQNGLEARFTFGESTASFTLKGESVAMACSSPREANNDDLAVFRQAGDQVGIVCSGKSKKGRVLAGGTNSMGLVQFKAFLAKPGQPAVRAVLNCNPARKDSGGW